MEIDNCTNQFIYLRTAAIYEMGEEPRNKARSNSLWMRYLYLTLIIYIHLLQLVDLNSVFSLQADWWRSEQR